MDTSTKSKIVVAVSVGGACAVFTAGLVLTILICRNRKMLRKRARERRLLSHDHQVSRPQPRAARHSLSVTSDPERDSPTWMIGTREATPPGDWQHRNSTNYSWARDASTNRMWGSNSVGVASWNCSRETSPHSPSIGQTGNSWAESNSVNHTNTPPKKKVKRPSSTSDWSRHAVNQSFDRNNVVGVHNTLLHKSHNFSDGRLPNGYNTSDPASRRRHNKQCSPERDAQSAASGLFIPCDEEEEQVNSIFVASMGGVRGAKAGLSGGSRVSDSGISSSTGSSSAWWLRPPQQMGGASGTVTPRDNVSHRNLEQILQSIENYNCSNNNNNNSSAYSRKPVLDEHLQKPHAGQFIQSQSGNTPSPNHRKVSVRTNQSNVMNVGSQVVNPPSRGGDAFLSPYWSDSITGRPDWTESNSASRCRDDPDTSSSTLVPGRRENPAELVEFDLLDRSRTSPIGLQNGGRSVATPQRTQTRRSAKDNQIWQPRAVNDMS